MEIKSEILKEAFAAKFASSLTQGSTGGPSTPSCDFCAFALSFLKRTDISVEDRDAALQELKDLYINKRFEFNRSITHESPSSGCLSFLMQSQELLDSRNKSTFLPFLEDLLQVTNPLLEDPDGNDILKVAIIHKFSSDFIQSIISSMEDKLTTKELNLQLNIKNSGGDTALSLAVKNSMDAVVTILTSCTPVLMVNIDKERNCLIHFIHKFKTKVWRRYLFLKDVKNGFGFFPLQLLAQNKVDVDNETFKKLIPSREVVNDRNVFGETLLQVLLKDKEWFSCERIGFMLDAGADMKVSVKESSLPVLPLQEAVEVTKMEEVVHSNDILSSPANNPFFLDTLAKVLDDDDIFSRRDNQMNIMVNSIMIGTQSNASSRPSSFPSIEDESTSSGYITAADTEVVGDNFEHGLLVPSSHRSGRLSGNLLSMDVPSAEALESKTSCIWNSPPNTVDPDVLPKAKSFASVAATKTLDANPETTTTKKVGAVGSKKSYNVSPQILQKLAASPVYTGKVNPSGSQSFSEFKRVMFETGKYKEIFRKSIRLSVDSASDVNSLIPTFGSKKKINRLYSDCATKMRALSGKAAIEMTRIFIAFKVDFNLKGNGENTNKASLMNVIKICEACNWTVDEQVEMIRLIVLEGNGDPHVTDNVGNDALKLAVHLELPIGIIEILCEKAMEDDSYDLFTSCNMFKQNIITISARCVKSTDSRDYLLKCMREQAKRREEQLAVSRSKQLENMSQKQAVNPIGPPKPHVITPHINPRPTASSVAVQSTCNKNLNLLHKMAGFLAKYPRSVNVASILAQYTDVNSNYENTPLYSACLERVLSLTLKLTSSKNTKSPHETNKQINSILDASYDMTREFIRLGVDFNRRNYNEKTCLCHTISLSKHYSFRKFFYSIIDLMIENGADVSLADSRGDDAIKHALFRKYPIDVIQKMLRSLGSKEKAVLISHNLDDLSTLDIARNHQELYSFLRDRLTLLRQKSFEDNKVSGVCIGKNMLDPDREDRSREEAFDEKYDNAKLKIADFMEAKASRPTTPSKNKKRNSLISNGDTSDRLSDASSNSSGVSCDSPYPGIGINAPLGSSLPPFANVPKAGPQKLNGFSTSLSEALMAKASHYFDSEGGSDAAWSSFPNAS